MPYPGTRPLKDRIEVELVEADVEIGFRLVDLAQASATDDPLFAAGATESAQAVCRDIEQRLAQMEDHERACFRPLVDELCREVESVRPRG